MDLFYVVLVVLVLYAGVRLIGSIAARLTGARHRAYRQLAQRYRGRYEHRGLVDPPTVSFAHNGSSVRVGLAPVVAGQSLPARTRVVARFGAGLPFRMELFPIQRPSPPQAARGTRPVRLGDPVFDRSFVVRANDPEIAAEYLREPAVRRAIDGLRDLSPPSGMLLSITPERLMVQVDRNLGLAVASLEAVVRGALTLHDLLRARVAARLAEGIAILDSAPTGDPEAGPPVCKVCNGAIDPGDDRVRCASCGTPHHRDCWGFVGGCSIYGCQEKQCVPA